MVNQKQKKQCEALLAAEKFDQSDLEGELPELKNYEVDEGWEQSSKKKVKKGERSKSDKSEGK